MTQTTYAFIQITGKQWLVPEPVMEKPDRIMHSPFGGYIENDSYKKELAEYNDYLQQKSDWIEIPKEHEKEFVGRTGLVEDEDFEVKQEWVYEKDGTNYHQSVAIPIKPDQGRDDLYKPFTPPKAWTAVPSLSTQEKAEIFAAMLMDVEDQKPDTKGLSHAEYLETHTKFLSKLFDKYFSNQPIQFPIKTDREEDGGESYYSRTVLKKAKELIEHALDEFEIRNAFCQHVLKNSIAIVQCGCECDDYNGFDCGCTQRVTITEEAIKELQNQSNVNNE